MKHKLMSVTIRRIAAVCISAAAVFGSDAALATKVMDSPCKDTELGKFDEVNHDTPLLCTNGRWQDITTLPVTSARFIVVDPTGKVLQKGFDDNLHLGVEAGWDRAAGFHFSLQVVQINPDHTARVFVDIVNGAWKKHVEAVVPFGTSTAIASGEDGESYKVFVGLVRS